MTVERPRHNTLQVNEGRPVWANRVIRELQAQGHSAGWLAGQIGTTRARMSEMLKGIDRARTPAYHPTPEVAVRIATALGVRYGALFQTICAGCGARRYDQEPCNCK